MMVLNSEYSQPIPPTQDAATTGIETAPDFVWPPTWFHSKGAYPEESPDPHTTLWKPFLPHPASDTWELAAEDLQIAKEYFEKNPHLVASVGHFATLRGSDRLGSGERNVKEQHVPGGYGS